MEYSETWCFKSFNLADMFQWPEELLEHEGSVVTLQLTWHVQNSDGSKICPVCKYLLKQLTISKANFRFLFRIGITSWHVTQATHKYELSRSEPNCTYLRLLLRTSYDMTACLFHLHLHFDSTHVCMDSIMSMLARVQPFPPWVETARRFAHGYLVRLRTHQVTSPDALILKGRWAAQIRMETSNTQVSLNATHFGGIKQCK